MTPSPQASESQNIVHLPDGSTHVFPAEATPDQMTQALQKLNLGVPHPTGPNKLTDEMFNKVIDFIRPIAGGAAGTLAATASAPAAAIPVVGGAIPFAADTQAYTLVDSALKQLKTDAPSIGEGLADSERDALINAVSGKVIGGIFRGVKGAVNAVRNANVPDIYKFAPTTSQALESYGYHTLATGAKFAEDFGAPAAKAAALDRAGGAGFSQALGFANALNGRAASVNADPVKLADKLRDTLTQNLTPNQAPNRFPTNLHVASQAALDVLEGGKNPFAKLDQVIQDPDRLSKVLAVSQIQGAGTNVRKDLQAYQFMRMFNDAMTKDATGNIRVDPKKITDVWTNPDLNTSLDTLYGKQGRQNVSDFIKNIAATQDKVNAYPVAKQLRLFGAGFAIPAGLITGNIHMAEAGAASVAGLYLPAAAAGRLLTDPRVARSLVSLAGGEPLSTSNEWFARMLASGLQGTTIAMLDSKGNKQWGELKKDPTTGDIKFVENK